MGRLSEILLPYSWQSEDRQVSVDLLVDVERLLDSGCIASYRENEKDDFEHLLRAAHLEKKTLATSRAKSDPETHFVAVYGVEGRDYSCLQRFILINENAHDFYFNELLPKHFAKHIDTFWNVFLATVEEIGHFSLDCNVPLTHHCTLPQGLVSGQTPNEVFDGAFVRNELADFLYDVNCTVPFSALDLLGSVVGLLVLVNRQGGVYHGFELDIRGLRANAKKA